MLLFSGLYFLLHLLCLASVASSLPVKRVSSNAAALAAAACSEQIKARDLKGLAVCYILGASGQNKQNLDLIVMLNQVDIPSGPLSLSVSWPDQAPASTPNFSLPQAARLFEPLLISHFNLPLPSFIDTAAYPIIKASSSAVELNTISLSRSDADATSSSGFEPNSARSIAKRQETETRTISRPAPTTRQTTGDGVLTLDMGDVELPVQTSTARTSAGKAESPNLTPSAASEAAAAASQSERVDAMGYRLGDGSTFRLPMTGIWLVGIVISAGSLAVGMTTFERRMQRKAFRARTQSNQSTAEEGGAEKKAAP